MTPALSFIPLADEPRPSSFPFPVHEGTDNGIGVSLSLLFFLFSFPFPCFSFHHDNDLFAMSPLSSKENLGIIFTGSRRSLGIRYILVAWTDGEIFSLFSYFILFSFYAISKSVNPLPFERKRIITVLLPRDITRLDAGMMRQE